MVLIVNEGICTSITNHTIHFTYDYLKLLEKGTYLHLASLSWNLIDEPLLCNVGIVSLSSLDLLSVSVEFKMVLQL